MHGTLIVLAWPLYRSKAALAHYPPNSIVNMSYTAKHSKDLQYSQEPSLEAQEVHQPGVEYDEVFGEYKQGQVHYKSVGWWVSSNESSATLTSRIKATIIMLKTIIALGVLAMPTVLSATGGVPGSLS
jgi:hypothetical protein